MKYVLHMLAEKNNNNTVENYNRHSVILLKGIR